MSELPLQVIIIAIGSTILLAWGLTNEATANNPPPEPAHCYEWLNDGWQDICL